MEHKRLTILQAAELLNTSPQSVRIGIQNRTLPIGFAVKRSSVYTYIIPAETFEAVTGIKTGG